MKTLGTAVDTVVYLWMGHTVGTVAQAYLRRKRKQRDSSTQVLFFPDSNIPCKKIVDGETCTNEHCTFSHEQTSLSSLLDCLRSARKSIDVAVFIITSQDLADLLIQAHRRGVVVRIITDCENMDLNNSQIEQFRANGIQVRHDRTSYLMHHKFAVVDKRVLVNGSFNWTRQAVSGNQENIIISKSLDIVRPYLREFQKLWEKYDPMAVAH